MIELLLSGGLGNQMFQYACARKLQIEYGETLVINTWLYGNGKDRFGRKCALKYLQIPSEITFVHKARFFVRIAGRASRYNRKLTYCILSAFGIYVWRDWKFKEIVFSSKQEKYLYGYFISEKFFLRFAEIIKKEFQIIGLMSHENKKMLKQIGTSNAVCVHIRRDDYINTEFEVCDLDYYQRAIKYIDSRTSDAKYYFFSDDIVWVKQHFIGSNYIFVDYGNKDYEDMELMRHCKHFIMSNSTFSWWAQYLSEYPDKIVVAPKHWMKGVEDDEFEDLYLKYWVKM